MEQGGVGDDDEGVNEGIQITCFKNEVFEK